MTSAAESLFAEHYVADTGTGLSPGRICWAPITFVEPRFQVAEVDGTMPSDDSATTFKIVPFTGKNHATHPPVFVLRLRVNEHLRVARMKRRPAIVLSARGDPWTDRGGNATRNSEKTRLLAPLYTIEDYSEAWQDRVRRFEYNTHFYLPACTLPRGAPNRDVFVRFEQSQTVHEKLIEPCDCRLADEVLDYLHAWFLYFIRGEHSEESELLTHVYEPAP